MKHQGDRRHREAGDDLAARPAGRVAAHQAPDKRESGDGDERDAGQIELRLGAERFADMAIDQRQ
jgi:hypothetical protein